ncbi:hypothetical protein [Dokdonella fugitiva]|uniref:Uncharacterized protein n=1 Tax=Dokdonella fugitiva TaxID=328517 RepID=A0A4R2I7V7_9GAMM|nr:hypothetical protein [Dokdonella fugitiva]TCO40431.1 hypothetical protein EV148_105226 [Dokdonella fugitiva]
MNHAESLRFAESFSELGVTPIWGQVERGEPDGISALRLATGGVVALRAPLHANTDHAEFNHAAKVLRIAASAAKRIADVEADATRTDAWKAEQRRAIAAAARNEIEGARVEAMKRIDEFAEADAKSCSPPPLAMNDAVGAAEDREVRDLWRAMSPDAQARLAHELMDGKHPRALVALMRSPMPLPGVLAATLPTAWANAMARANPREATLRSEAQERLAWLRTVVPQYVEAIDALAPKKSLEIRAA